MADETEVKIQVSDLEKLREKLLDLNAQVLSDRHFEENSVLDTQEGRLRADACLLRVRKTKGKESVTFKGPPRPSVVFKSREESETVVESADTMLKIFKQIGMEVWFRYEKYREEFSVPVSSGPPGEILVALDATPIGDYAELEGSEEGIREVAKKLGLGESQFLRDSYYSLFVRFCRERGEEPKHMVFR
jgi:adenylate cyclase class 2